MKYKLHTAIHKYFINNETTIKTISEIYCKYRNVLNIYTLSNHGNLFMSEEQKNQKIRVVKYTLNNNKPLTNDTINNIKNHNFNQEYSVGMIQEIKKFIK